MQWTKITTCNRTWHTIHQSMKLCPVIAHLNKNTSQFESCSKIYWCFSILLFISACLMSSFVLVLSNQNKERLIPIVLFNKRQIRAGTNHGHFKIRCALQGFRPSVKQDKSSFEEPVWWSWHACVCVHG